MLYFIQIRLKEQDTGAARNMLTILAWNADDWTFEALTAHYKTLVRYINFEDQGMILGYGCGTPAMTKRSRYPDQAYALGKNL